jgi:hypothetical protein
LVRTRRKDRLYFEANELGRQLAKQIEVSLRIPILNDNVFSLDVAKLAETLPEYLVAGEISGMRPTAEES